MVGIRQKVDYLSDDGNHYAVGIPAWQVALAGGPAATGLPAIPYNSFRPRYRMVQNTATGREKKVVCHSTTSPFWLEAMNTAHANLDDGTKNGITSAISSGRIGERVLNRA